MHFLNCKKLIIAFLFTKNVFRYCFRKKAMCSNIFVCLSIYQDLVQPVTRERFGKTVLRYGMEVGNDS